MKKFSTFLAIALCVASAVAQQVTPNLKLVIQTPPPMPNNWSAIVNYDLEKIDAFGATVQAKTIIGSTTSPSLTCSATANNTVFWIGTDLSLWNCSNAGGSYVWSKLNAGTAVTWGSITGTLSSQTDLQSALNAKWNVPTFSNVVALWASGSCSGYLKSDGTCSTPSAAVWGSITGTLSSQTDLQTALNGKWNVPTFASVVALWASGSCTSGYLKYDGTCSTPSGSGSPTILTAGSTIVTVDDSRAYVDNESGSPITVTAYSSTGTSCTLTTSAQTLSSASSIQLYGSGWPAGWLTTNNSQIYPVTSATSTSVVFPCGQAAGSGSLSGSQLHDATNTWPIQLGKFPSVAGVVTPKSQVSYASPGNTTLDHIKTDLTNGVYPSCSGPACYSLIVPTMFDFWAVCSGAESMATYEGNLQSIWASFHSLGYTVIQSGQFPSLSTSVPYVCDATVYAQNVVSLNSWLQGNLKNQVVSGSPSSTQYIDHYVAADSVYNDISQNSNLQSATTGHFGDDLHSMIASQFAEYFATGSDVWKRNTCGFSNNCGPLNGGNTWTGSNFTSGNGVKRGGYLYGTVQDFWGFDNNSQLSHWFADSSHTLTQMGSFGLSTYPQYGLDTWKVNGAGTGVMDETSPQTIRCWSPGVNVPLITPYLSDCDTGLSRKAAGVVALGNGTGYQDTSGALALTGIFGQATAPAGTCTSAQGGMWQLTQDGAITRCPTGGGTWTTFLPGSSPLTTKGDIYVHSTVDTRLPVGPDGDIIYADSTQSTGLRWDLPPSGSFTAGGDLSGTSSSQTVIGLKTVPFCTGYTPTNGQLIQYTTGGTPSPCYNAVTISGGGNVSASGTPSSGDLASWVNATTIKTATATEVNTVIQGLTGCNTSGNVYTPQSGTCVAPGSSSVPYASGYAFFAESSSTLASVTTNSVTLSVGDVLWAFWRSGTNTSTITFTDSKSNTWHTNAINSNGGTLWAGSGYAYVTTGGATTITATPNVSGQFQSLIVVIIKGLGGTGFVNYATGGSASNVSSILTTLSLATTQRTFVVMCTSIGSVSGSFNAFQSIAGVPANLSGFPTSTSNSNMDGACTTAVVYATQASIVGLSSYTTIGTPWDVHVGAFNF